MTTIAEYLAHQPEAFGPVVSFGYYQVENDDGDTVRFVELFLAKGKELGREQLVLRFNGVKGLHFAQAEAAERNMTVFGRVDIREQAGGFLVQEESSLLRLWCESFDILDM